MDDATREEVTRLLKRGLNHYGRRELDAAIACWEKARELDPDNRAARDYLETAYDESPSGHPAASAPAAENPFDDSDTPRTGDAQRADGGPPDLPGSDDEVPDTLVRGALDAYKAGELDRAWQLLQDASGREPDRLDLQGYLAMVRSERARQWARDIGDQGQVLRLNRSTQELMRLNLSPEEGFLLSQIDGSLSIEELLNLSSDRVRTLEIVAKFIREGLVA